MYFFFVFIGGDSKKSHFGVELNVEKKKVFAPYLLFLGKLGEHKLFPWPLFCLFMRCEVSFSNQRLFLKLLRSFRIIKIIFILQYNNTNNI